MSGSREARAGSQHTRHAYGRVAKHPSDFNAEPAELTVFDPRLILGYYRRLEAILDACPVDIYAASSLKHPWPYRLQNAAECYPASFWRSHNRILDSAIGSPELSNQDVLDHAVERHATAVVVKDYLPFEIYDDDQQDALPTVDNHVEATTESIFEFIELHDPDVHPPAYIPLQPPYDKHVRAVWDAVDRSHLEHRYMLGGLKDATPKERINALLAFRSEVGPEPIAHGLGWGLSDELVRFLREHPGLLDSVDNSGPSNAIQSDAVLDKHWQANDCKQVDGQYQNTIGGAFEFAMLLSGAHRLTKFNDDFEDVPKQRTFGEFGGETDD